MNGALALAPPIAPAEVQRPEDRIKCEPYRAIVFARACVEKRRGFEARARAVAGGPKAGSPGFSQTLALKSTGENKCRTCPVGPVIEQIIGRAVEGAPPLALGTLPAEPGPSRRRLKLAPLEDHRQAETSAPGDGVDDVAEAASERDSEDGTVRPLRDQAHKAPRQATRTRVAANRSAAAPPSPPASAPRSAAAFATPEQFRPEMPMQLDEAAAQRRGDAAKTKPSGPRNSSPQRAQTRPGRAGYMLPEQPAGDLISDVARWREEGAALRARVDGRLAELAGESEALQPVAELLRALAAAIPVDAPATKVAGRGHRSSRRVPPAPRGGGPRLGRAEERHGAVLAELAAGPRSMAEVMKRCKLSMGSVQHSLRTLRARGQAKLTGARTAARWHAVPGKGR